VIDPVRLAGIQNVGIITDQRQPTPRQNPAAATGIPVWVISNDAGHVKGVLILFLPD
jgi:hypothetical protein